MKIDFSKHQLIQDLPRKIAFSFLVFSVLLMLVYQASFIWNANTSQFLDADNLLYYSFANMALQHGIFNTSISNPYLVYSSSGFFESAGLYQLPALLHVAMPLIPLIWDFRILFGLAVLGIYLFTLLIARRILNSMPLNQAYKYVAYAMIIMSILFMQYGEIIEWRGNTFITLFGLLISYLICLIWLNKDWSIFKKLGALALCFGLLAASYYMWSAWIINLLPFALIPIFLVYDKVKDHPKLYWGLAVFIFFIAVAICVFTLQVQHLIVNLLFNIKPLSYTLDCFYNPLNLSEVQCLNFTNGLYTVALDMFFLAITIKVFLSDRTFSIEKYKYDYFIIGIAALILLGLPFVLVYVRLLQIIAPYLTLSFAIGTVTILARMGSSRWVQCLVVLIILVFAVISVMIFWQTTAILYTVSNPVGLQNAANWLAMQPIGKVVFAWYGWGDMLEVYGHQRTFVDTIQELNISLIQSMDNFYMNDSCTLPKLPIQPDFIVASNSLSIFTTFENASNTSFVYNPLGLEKCGDTLAYSDNGFYVFKVGS